MLLTSVVFLIISLFLKVLPGGSLELLTSGFGVLDLAELENLNYKLEIQTQPVTDTLLQEKETGKETSDQWREFNIQVVSKKGQRYSCSLPQLAQESDVDILDKDVFVDIGRLLTQLKQKCLFMNKGWWTYQYCHGDKIMQFHLESGKIIGNIVHLGFFENEKVWTPETLQKAFSQQRKNKHAKDPMVTKLPSHDLTYVNGTLCGLTDNLRSTQAKVVCSPYHINTQIINVIEHETCNYTVVIHAPQLCDHPLFIPDSKRDSTAVISCSPVLSEKQYEKYMKEESVELSKAKVKEVVTEQAILKANNERQIPLSDLLSSLANSIMEKVEANIETKKKKKEENTRETEAKKTDNKINKKDDEWLDKETEAMIDNLVADTLHDVFKGTKKDTESSDTNSQSSTDSDLSLNKDNSPPSDENTEVGKDLQTGETKVVDSVTAEGQETESETKHDEKSSGTKGQGKVKVYHVKLGDAQQSLKEQDIHEILDQITEEEEVKGESRNDKKAKENIVEIDLTKQPKSKETATLLASVIEELLGESAEDKQDKQRQQTLEENYDRSWDSQNEDEES